MSDHRYTVFQVGALEVTWPTYHNPKKTNWESYWEDLKVNPGVVPRVIHTAWNIELDADRLQKASPKLPARVAHLPRIVPWWNKEVSCLKASTIQLFNQAKRTDDWNSYEPAITNRLERPNSPLGGTTVKGSKMYLTGSD